MVHKIHYSKGMRFFGERAEKIFGFEKYDPIANRYFPVFFSGLYFPEDYETFKNHQGEKAIFWNGSDIQILAQNPTYQKIIKSFPKTNHACHSELLQKELKELGINAKIRPIFFGDIENYPVSYEQKSNPEVFLTAHPKREKEYGVDIVENIAPKLPNIKFHIYGIKKRNTENIIFHGQVEETIMDQEIKKLQGSLRLNQHDGLSQSVIKSILLGQYPTTKIPYPGIWTTKNEQDLILFLHGLKREGKPNIKAREYYLPKLNNFDWLEPEKEGISLVMIAKNEERGLEKAILSCKDFVDEIVISVDKNSTDKTSEIAKKYADILLQHQWEDDFSKARNYAQEHATKKWVFILDGHEYVKEYSNLDEILKLDTEGFFVRLKYKDGFMFYTPRLFRKYVKWVNPVHNYPAFIKSRKYKELLIIHDRLDLQTREAVNQRTVQREKMNTKILKERIKANKKDARSLFYLAQQYRGGRQWKKALKYYRKYIKYPRNYSERWLAYYEMAQCANLLNKPKLAIKFLKAAEKTIPNRWETLKHQGSTYMLLGEWKKALPYLINSFTITKGDYLFNPEERNNAQTWYFIAECFFNLKEPEKAKTAMHRALKIHEEAEHGTLPEEQIKVAELISGTTLTNTIIKAGGFKFKIRKEQWDKAILTGETNPEYYRMPQNPKVVVDIGAHIGGTSILAASLGADVYAYEPENENFKLLKENIKLNDLENKIQCFQKGVGTPGKRKLYLNSKNSGMATLEPGNNPAQEVDIIEIDKVFEKIDHCDLLKIDCEGAEYEFICDVPFEKIDHISMELHKGTQPQIINYLKKFYNVQTQPAIDRTSLMVFCAKKNPPGS